MRLAVVAIVAIAALVLLPAPSRHPGLGYSIGYALGKLLFVFVLMTVLIGVLGSAGWLRRRLGKGDRVKWRDSVVTIPVIVIAAVLCGVATLLIVANRAVTTGASTGVRSGNPRVSARQTAYLRWAIIFYGIAPTQGLVGHRVGDIKRQQRSGPVDPARLASDLNIGYSSARLWSLQVGGLPAGDPGLVSINAELKRAAAVQLQAFQDVLAGIRDHNRRLLSQSDTQLHEAAQLLRDALARNSRLYHQLGGDQTFLSHSDFAQAVRNAAAISAANSRATGP